MIVGKGTRRYKISWTGTEKDLIERTDRLAHDTVHGQLDSLDLGDTLGFWIWYLNQTHDQLKFTPHPMTSTMDGYIWKVSEGTLKIEFTDDLFEWDMDATELPGEFE